VSVVWGDQPAFPASHLPPHTRRYLVDVEGRNYWVDWDGNGAPTAQHISPLLPGVDLRHARIEELPRTQPVANLLTNYEPPPARWQIKDLIANLTKKEPVEDIPQTQVRMPESYRVGAVQPIAEVIASEPEADDGVLRRDAINTINLTVASALRTPDGEQTRYELALMARNGMVSAMSGFAREAQARKLTVAELVEEIIGQRKVRERRSFQLNALKAEALAKLDDARGDEIAQVLADALAEINQEG